MAALVATGPDELPLPRCDDVFASVLVQLNGALQITLDDTHHRHGAGARFAAFASAFQHRDAFHHLSGIVSPVFNIQVRFRCRGGCARASPTRCCATIAETETMNQNKKMYIPLSLFLMIPLL